MIEVDYWLKRGWKLRQPQDYQCERMEVGGFILVRNGKTALTRAQWAARGYLINNMVTPHATIVVGNWGVDVFREDQVYRRVQLPWGVLGLSVFIGAIIGVIIGISIR